MAAASTDNKRIAKNTILLGIRMVIVLGVSLYTSRVILQVLGVEDYGIFNVVGGFVVMFGFLNSAMTTGIQRFYNFELGRNGEVGANKVFVTSIYTQFILALIVLALLESVGVWYLYNKMVLPPERLQSAFWIFQFSVASMMVGMLKVPYTASIVSHEKMDYYAFLGIYDTVLKLIIVIILPYISADKLIMYGGLILCISISDYILNFLYAHIKFKEVRFRFEFHKRLFLDMLSFSGWNIFGKFSVMIKDQGLNMILNLFFGPVVNAARGVAYQVTGALNGFVENVNVAAKPQLTQSFAKGDLKRTFDLMFGISKLNYFILYILSLPICIELDWILRFWLGDNVPQYTSIFIILVILSSLRGTLSTQVSYVVQASGIMRKYQVITSLLELTMIPIAYTCLKMGANPPAVFVVSFFVSLVVLVVGLFILRDIVHVSLKDYSTKVVFPLLIASVLSIILPLTLNMLMEESLWRVVSVFIVSIISSFLGFFFFAVTSQERKSIISISKTTLNKVRNRK